MLEDRERDWVGLRVGKPQRDREIVERHHERKQGAGREAGSDLRYTAKSRIRRVLENRRGTIPSSRSSRTASQGHFRCCAN